jgi:hypothetical protein
MRYALKQDFERLLINELSLNFICLKMVKTHIAVRHTFNDMLFNIFVHSILLFIEKILVNIMDNIR